MPREHQRPVAMWTWIIKSKGQAQVRRRGCQLSAQLGVSERLCCVCEHKLLEPERASERDMCAGAEEMRKALGGSYYVSWSKDTYRWAADWLAPPLFGYSRGVAPIHSQRKSLSLARLPQRTTATFLGKLRICGPNTQVRNARGCNRRRSATKLTGHLGVYGCAQNRRDLTRAKT